MRQARDLRLKEKKYTFKAKQEHIKKRADDRRAAKRDDAKRQGGRNGGDRAGRGCRGWDADAPEHVLTFRSLCTMSCW